MAALFIFLSFVWPMELSNEVDFVIVVTTFFYAVMDALVRTVNKLSQSSIRLEFGKV